ncbi:MAG: GatB/YqeY domain-containing protein [Bdellovibrio sp.]|nr:MAG: GatB/YqeY domain-containing protein [Bdellovibrio sp.]
MSLKDQIMADIKSAMKESNQEKVACLRFLHSAIKNKEIEIRPKELTDDDVLSVIKKQVKQRKDSIEQYEKAGRADLVAKETKEVEILETYLPEQMGEEQVAALVDDVIKKLGASSMKDMGAVMKEVISQAKGAADNKLISQVVKSKLQ